MLFKKFNLEVSIPDWKYCNLTDDKKSKNDNEKCHFLNKDVKNFDILCVCKLFQESLFTNGQWVLKCDSCIEKLEEQEMDML